MKKRYIVLIACASLSLVAFAPVSINQWTKVAKTYQDWQLIVRKEKASADRAAWWQSPEGKLRQQQIDQETKKERWRESHHLKAGDVLLVGGDIYTANGYILHPDGDWNYPPPNFHPKVLTSYPSGEWQMRDSLTPPQC